MNFPEQIIVSVHNLRIAWYMSIDDRVEHFDRSQSHYHRYLTYLNDVDIYRETTDRVYYFLEKEWVALLFVVHGKFLPRICLFWTCSIAEVTNWDNRLDGRRFCWKISSHAARIARGKFAGLIPNKRLPLAPSARPGNKHRWNNIVLRILSIYQQRRTVNFQWIVQHHLRNLLSLN